MISSKMCLGKNLNNLTYLIHKQFSNTYEIIDSKNSHLLFIKDPSASLPFMSQVTLETGEKGVVIKIGNENVTTIGMYHKTDVGNELKVEKCEKIKDLCAKFNAHQNCVYSIDGKQLTKKAEPIRNQSMATQLKSEGKRKRLNILSPILSVCEDIFIGDFVGLAGPLGSYRTTNALKYLQAFVNSQNLDKPLGIYLNTSQKDSEFTCGKAAMFPHTLCFGRDKNSKPLTSVGVYMLAIKCLQVGKRLKKQGNNVLLVMDNLQQILSNQWTILQNLKQPISPISILNEMYSNSSNNSLKSGLEGSLTSIFTNNPEDQDVLQQYTTFGNNSKYLRTLCHQIQHPLQVRVNNNSFSSHPILHKMRQNINRLVKQKKQTQLLTRLKLNKDDPWDQYYILDSEWWMAGVKAYQPRSFADLQLFLWFINTNIEEDYCAHWNINCIQAYTRYLDYLAHPEDLQLGKDINQMQNFIELAKVDGVFQIFKKDYLL